MRSPPPIKQDYLSAALKFSQNIARRIGHYCRWSAGSVTVGNERESNTYPGRILKNLAPNLRPGLLVALRVASRPGVGHTFPESTHHHENVVHSRRSVARASFIRCARRPD
jgi:hypothetical protein